MEEMQMRRGKDTRSADASDKRRRLLVPYAARLLAVTPVRRMSISSTDVASRIHGSLGVSVEPRTISNYLALRTQCARDLVPPDFKQRLRRARLRPKLKDYDPLTGDFGAIRLLGDIVEDCQHDALYERVALSAHAEMELIRASNQMQTDIQRPMRVSLVQPVAGGSLPQSLQFADGPYNEDLRALADDIWYGDRDGDTGSKDASAYAPGVISLLDQAPAESDVARWWSDFSSLRTTAIPYSVQDILSKKRRQPRRVRRDPEDGRPLLPYPTTMGDLIEWQKAERAYKAANARLSHGELFLAYEARGPESAKTFFERIRVRLPPDIRSLRTLERRYADWKNRGR